MLFFYGILLLASCRSGSEKNKAQVEKVPAPRDETAIIRSESIHKAALDGNLKVVSGLLDGGTDPDMPDPEGRTTLMYASYNGHTEIVRMLIGKGADVNLADPNGTTALMMASSGPYPQTVKLLLDNLADPDITDQVEHFTALMYAASEGQLEVVKLLLAYGADPDLKDVDGDGAIQFALKNGHNQVADFLKSFSDQKQKK